MAAATSSGLVVDTTLPIPTDGLEEIVRLWSGAGDAYRALGCIEPSPGDNTQEWSPTAVRDRARRVGYAMLVSELAESAWPATSNVWREALPAESVRPWVTADHPQSSTDWVATRRLGSWPAVEFVGRPRRRIPDTLLSATLRWCLEEIDELRASAVRVEPTATSREPVGMPSTLALLDEPPLESALGVRPTRAELRAVRREGWPWTALTLAATELLRQGDLGAAAVATELLFPDPEIEWRMFHLAVFGEVLLGLKDCGAGVRSLRPLGIGSGPVHEVRKDDRLWDLWFEAAGLPAHYGGRSPYAAVARQLHRRPRSLQPDIALVRRDDRRARVWECKYSMDDAYLRVGIMQSLAYLTEVEGALGTEPAVSLNVPDPAARDVAGAAKTCGRVSVEAASTVRQNVASFVSS